MSKLRNTMQRTFAMPLLTVTLACAAAGLVGCAAMSGRSSTGQETFRTPDQAVAALAELAGSGDAKRTEALFGSAGVELLQSGDDVADRQGALKAKALIAEKVTFEDVNETTKIAVFGNDAWPFPFPLVRDHGRWRFDTEAGREELENRRIGGNELSTIATLHAIVDAQKEYFAGRHDGHSKTYATRLISSDGKRDGLYWPSAEGEDESPLGPLVAEAAAQGYSTDNAEPEPYHGYYFRPLTAQGKHAAGGARNYIDAKGLQTRGFATIAWPAKYGNSGIMTFLVDSQGIVFQKDLGEGTAAAVAAIEAYDPDESWAPTGD